MMLGGSNMSTNHDEHSTKSSEIEDLRLLIMKLYSNIKVDDIPEIVRSLDSIKYSLKDININDEEILNKINSINSQLDIMNAKLDDLSSEIDGANKVVDNNSSDSESKEEEKESGSTISSNIVVAIFTGLLAILLEIVRSVLVR